MPSKITDKNLINSIVEDFKNGKSKNQIGRDYNISPPTIKKLIAENFEQKYSRISYATIQKIVELSKTADSKTEIARTLGVDRNTVDKVLKDHNVKFKWLKPEIIESIVEDYKLNLMSITDLCVKYGRNYATIKKVLTKNDAFVKLKTYFSSDDPEWLTYSKLARKLTGSVIRFYELESPEGYHWDHKISIYEGYGMNIPAYLIASRENLELIPVITNLKKKRRSSITHEDLLRQFNLQSVS